MTLSVIIPIYNVESTLRRCLDSVLAQGVADLELILVDDGSTDTSAAIAECYAARHAGVRCFHKPNGGLSDARNYGIARATGRYITFVDSDDELAPGTYAPLLRVLAEHEEYDILEYAVLQNPGRSDETPFSPGNHVFGNALDWLAYKGFGHCWACNKIYKASMFDGVQYPVGRKFEDVLALIPLLKKRPVIATTCHGTYIYHYNASGIAATDRAGGLSSLLDAQLSLVEQLHINTRERRWHRLYVDMLAIQIVTYRKTGSLRLWRQHVVPWGYATWKDCVKALLLDIIGLRLTCMVLGKRK